MLTAVLVTPRTIVELWQFSTVTALKQGEKSNYIENLRESVTSFGKLHFIEEGFSEKSDHEISTWNIELSGKK